MKVVLARMFAALVLMSLAACGADVPAALADKVNSGCPGLVEPEPVAVITKGFTVSVVDGATPNSCKITVSTGKDVLHVALVAYPDADTAEKMSAMLCPNGTLDGPDKSCTTGGEDRGRFALHGPAGRHDVRIAVYEIPVNDEVKDAAHQILEDLRSSARTK